MKRVEIFRGGDILKPKKKSINSPIRFEGLENRILSPVSSLLVFPSGRGIFLSCVLGQGDGGRTDVDINIENRQ